MRVPHDLRDEFPQETAFIEQLTGSSHEFRNFVTRYDEINLTIFRIESEQEPTTDEVLERLKKRRLKLKDTIAAMLWELEHRM